jgi:hypothetical protein
MASTVTFGSTVVNGPEPGTQISQIPLDVQQATPNQVLWHYRLSTAKRWRWTMTLTCLTAAMKTALETFFWDTAKASANTFSYTHTDGTTYANTRFDQLSLDFTRGAPGMYDVQITLVLQTAPGG